MNTSQCEKYETYTIKIDSMYSTSNNSFVSYIDVPLRNVVKSEVLLSSVSANVASSNVIYVYVKELNSKFNDKAALQTAISVSGKTSNIGGVTPTAQLSNVGYLRNSLITYPADPVNVRSVFTTSSGWDTSTEYIEPIRQVQQFTVGVYGESGNLVPAPGPTFLGLRLTCSKQNVCLY